MGRFLADCLQTSSRLLKTPSRRLDDKPRNPDQIPRVHGFFATTTGQHVVAPNYPRAALSCVPPGEPSGALICAPPVLTTQDAEEISKNFFGSSFSVGENVGTGY
ncbi:hypothetical protein Bbelb_235740 [Branchiostoma belcheri]|nr:hypothetical protein Bbelb_235740 [Branchiostoma belcheri]